MSDEVDRLRTFFRIAFDEASEGFVCIASKNVVSKAFNERFFHLPADFEEMLEYCVANGTTHDLWFCPNLLNGRKRTKNHIKETPTAWADLDECNPKHLSIKPSVITQTSPGRFQALWRFKEDDVAPIDAEDVSRRIAYGHLDQGADKSGWDLTQLLRVPLSYNHKYSDLLELPLVQIESATGYTYSIREFDIYEQVEEFSYTDMPFPEEVPDADLVLKQYENKMNGRVATLYYKPVPKGDDWSKALWELEMMCFEIGMSLDQTFALAANSACNKYARDKRSPKYLWREVCRAWEHHQQNMHNVAPSIILDAGEDLLTEHERQWCRENPTFVEEYIAWARTLGDAAWQYHQAGAFIILSSLLAANIKLPTSFGTVKPNLWFMILADTTLTRKTTAMDIAMDVLEEVDDNAVLATDGSIEGLLSALATRPNRSSLFLRDEFTGLVDAMAKRDFLAGMMESFTKMYDGKAQKRILRRETIDVRDPVLILFTGGIKNRMLSLLNYEHVMSGFLPRFVFITAEVDITKIKPVGPPTDTTTGERDRLIKFLRELHEHYNDSVNIVVNGKKTSTSKKIFNITMTPEAWKRYNVIEMQLVNSSLESIHMDTLMPMLDRLSKSGLKAAMLIAACRMESEVVVTEQDIIRAFYYVEGWRKFSIEVVANIGKNTFEKIIDTIAKTVEMQPGTYRGDIMRKLHLNARQAEDYLMTLEQRNIIIRKRSGKTERIYPIGAG